MNKYILLYYAGENTETFGLRSAIIEEGSDNYAAEMARLIAGDRGNTIEALYKIDRAVDTRGTQEAQHED